MWPGRHLARFCRRVMFVLVSGMLLAGVQSGSPGPGALARGAVPAGRDHQLRGFSRELRAELRRCSAINKSAHQPQKSQPKIFNTAHPGRADKPGTIDLA